MNGEVEILQSGVDRVLDRADQMAETLTARRRLLQSNRGRELRVGHVQR